jgi:hypothetical protein
MSKSSNHIRAMEIYNQHIALASVDGRLFRKTVREQIMSELGSSDAAASTFYNNCKKAHAPVEGLGRAPVPKGLRKPGATKVKADEELQDDNECHTIMEIINDKVCRCESFLLQGDASECFDSKTDLWPTSKWVHIQGLGPNSGETFKLDAGEKLIKEYSPKQTVS